jgi:signal transduction histidine kinase/CheY-like chemotaxis protein
MNIAVVVGVTGTLTGLLIASFSLGMARSPFWPERRWFAIVAATAAGFCGFDLGLVLPLPPTAIAALTQVALAFAGLHGVSWIRYLAAAERRPLRRTEIGMCWSGLAVVVAGLVPGLLLTHDLTTFRIEWLGVTYQTPAPTTLGLAVYAYCAVALAVVGASAWRQRRDGRLTRVAVAGVIVLGVLAANDTLASARFISTPLLLDSGCILVVACVGIAHQWHYAAGVRALELSSARLEAEVLARTRELIATQDELAHRDRLANLGRLAAGVAHEINNPLAVIQHAFERLRRAAVDGERPATTVTLTDSGLAATERITRIVRQLLVAGRVAGPGRPALETFPVVQVVKRAAAGARHGFRDIDIDVASELMVYGHPGMVEQALENLITNAWHAVGASAEHGRLSIRATRTDHHVRITVSDNGSGIADSIRPRLFEPFTSTKAVGTGTGLGLAVSQGLMRSQDGDLLLVATSASGTEMALELPWSSAAPASGHPLCHPEEPLAATDVRLLVIDDEIEVGEMLVDAASQFCHADLAHSIEDAITKVSDGLDVDAVLCDLMMPDGGAAAWLERVQLVRPLLAERTIIITGGPTSDQAAALVEALKDRTLYKPFSVAALRGLVLRLART